MTVSALEPAPTMARVAEIEGEVAEVMGIINASFGRLVALTSTADAEQISSGIGIRSTAHWLTWHAGLAPGTARNVARLAKRAAELPTTIELLTEGRLSLDQAAVVARHVPAPFEAAAADLATQAMVGPLSRILAAYGYDPASPDDGWTPNPDLDDGDTTPEGQRGGAAASGPEEATAGNDPEGPSADASENDMPPAPSTGSGPRRSAIEETRSVSMHFDDSGTWHLHAQLPADEGALIEAAIRAARDDLYRQASADLDANAPRPQVTLADGLLATAEASLAAGEARAPGSDRFLIHAHLEAGPVGGRPVNLGLHLGSPLPDHLRRLLTCDATCRPVLERHGTPCNVGRDQRIVPRRLRRLIEHRDRGCAMPNCDRRTGLEVHHIIHWEDGGPTDTSNLLTLCRAHHRQHHLGVISISGDADATGTGGVEFRDTHNRLIGPVGEPIPPRFEGDIRQAAISAGVTPGRWTQPGAEPIQAKWIWLAPKAPPPPARAGPAAA